MKEHIQKDSVKITIPTIEIRGDVKLSGGLDIMDGSWITGASLQGPQISDASLQDASFTFGISVAPQSCTPDSSQAVGNGDGTNRISDNVTRVILTANTTAVTDFFVLPDIANLEQLHEITILAGAANCEMRTPASSNTKINGVDADGGAASYEVIAGQVVTAVKISDSVGWMVYNRTALGAIVTVTTPN